MASPTTSLSIVAITLYFVASTLSAGVVFEFPTPSSTRPKDKCGESLQPLLKERFDTLEQLVNNQEKHNSEPMNQVLESLARLETLTATAVRRIESLEQETQSMKEKLKSAEQSIGAELVSIRNSLADKQPNPLEVRLWTEEEEEEQTDCARLYLSGYRGSGIHTVRIGHRSLRVWCDMETDGGGWTLLLRRDDFPDADGRRVSFNQDWKQYQDGFGDLEGEYWMGLDAMHDLGNQTLRVELEDRTGQERWAQYRVFSVGTADEQYRLQVDGYSGNAGDSLVHHTGAPFSTPDQDNDNQRGNCAALLRSGWWFHACHHANLNGPYRSGVVWSHWRGRDYPLKSAQMKVRPIDFQPDI